MYLALQILKFYFLVFVMTLPIKKIELADYTLMEVHMGMGNSSCP